MTRVLLASLLAVIGPGLWLPDQASKPGAKAKSPASAAKREQAVPFRVGETLTYDIGWSSYVSAGTATVTVQEKKPSYGSTAYYIVAEGKPTPLLSKLYTLYYKVDTLLEAYTLLPQRGAVFAREGSRSRMKSTTFNHATRKARYEIQTATLVKRELSLPAYSQDALSSLYVLRSIPLKAGDRFNMPVTDNGNIYKVQMNVGALETVQTGMGPVRAIKITPVILGAAGSAPGRGLALWLSDDARRLPVRLEAQLAVGTVTLVLRQATGG